MGGRQTALVIAIALTLLSSTHPAWTPDSARRTVQRSDLVVRGVIASIDTTMAPEYGRQYPSTRLHLDVSEVIKGTWEKRKLDAVLLGTAEAGTAGVTYDYRPDEDVILCLRFDPKLHSGTYRFWVDQQSFVNRDGTWTTRDRRGVVSLESVREAARQTDPEAMAREADAVLVGTVSSVQRRTLNRDGSSSAGDDSSRSKPTADYARVLVTDGLKDLSSGDSLLVRVLRRGRQLDWWEPVPPLQPGTSYLMFLKKDDVGYYPFRGFNGFLEVRGRALMLNERVLYSRSLSQVMETVRHALKP